MPLLGRTLNLPLAGKVLEVLWDHTPLPIPNRTAVRSYGDGRKMLLSLTDRTQRAMFCGAYEPAETAAVRQLLVPGATFVDAGAHVGWFTVIAAHLTGPRGQVHAIEAFPDNAAALRRNVKLNNLTNVIVHDVALSDHDGTVVVGRQTGSDSGSVTAGPGAEEAQVEVRASRLDQVVPTGPIALLKIDVEGLETRVFSAAASVLTRTEAVMIEVNPGALERNASSEEQLIGLLANAGLSRVSDLTRPFDAIRSRLAPTYRNVIVRR